MTNDDARDLLTAVAAQLTVAVTGKSLDGVDSRYAYAMGAALGICTEGLAAVREDRPMRHAIQPEADEP